MARVPQVLSRRALNRALLARQMLLRPIKLPAAAAIERLVGMQAQAPNLPYVGLWARLQGFRPDELSLLMRTRRTVRTTLMRGTIHLVTTKDALGLRLLFQPFLERGFFHGSPWGRLAGNVDPKALLDAGREIMGERPHTVAELAKRLELRFPSHDGVALAYGVRHMLPMVFATPRGIWRASGPVTLTTVEAWLASPSPATLQECREHDDHVAILRDDRVLLEPEARHLITAKLRSGKVKDALAHCLAGCLDGATSDVGLARGR